MPYPIAHPAAVLPLVGPMGKFAVPSALVIGSIAPDLWYFVPFVSRDAAHSASALVWFCLPAGCVIYALFHLLLKHPLIALLPQAVSRRLGSFTCPSLPAVSWLSAVVSLLTGALTHITWDALTHSNDYAIHGHNWAQHASTALGSAVLAWWLWRKLRRAPVSEPTARLSPLARTWILMALVAAMAFSAWGSMDATPWLSADLDATRRMVKTGGMAAVEGFCLATIVYCLLWRMCNRSVTRLRP